MSINNAFWIQLYAIITLCFCGVVQYFTGILAVLWLPVIMAFATTGMLLIQTQRTPLARPLVPHVLPRHLHHGGGSARVFARQRVEQLFLPIA